MPINIEIADEEYDLNIFDKVFSYFEYIDNKFSTYKKESEISKYNAGQITNDQLSLDMKRVFALSEMTKRDTGGYFDIYNNGKCDPSGLVKGWAIYNAGKMLDKVQVGNFYVEAGRDIEIRGKKSINGKWKVGIADPFDETKIVKIVYLRNCGIATSGTYSRGEHIYNPKTGGAQSDILSFSVIGPNVYEADKYATAAFAMGRSGISFIENKKGLEGYMIDREGVATLTSGFEIYTTND